MRRGQHCLISQVLLSLDMRLLCEHNLPWNSAACIVAIAINIGIDTFLFLKLQNANRSVFRTRSKDVPTKTTNRHVYISLSTAASGLADSALHGRTRPLTLSQRSPP